MPSYQNADSHHMTFKITSTVATTTSLYKCCYVVASMTVALPSGAADKIVGIINTPTSEGSEYVDVIYHGLAKGAMLSLTVASAGDMLVPAAGGALNKFTTNTTAQYIVGMALTTSRTGGAVTLLVNPHKYGVEN